jgi:excisionase family DNA binding protein
MDHAEQREPGTAPATRRLITVVEAADSLSISRAKLYELISAGEVTTVHIGRSVRIPVHTLDEFVERLQEQSAL